MADSAEVDSVVSRLDEEEDEKKEEEEESQKVKVVNNKLIGECYIYINKLFKDDIRAVNFLI